MNKNWYAVFTRSACEKKVAAQLAKWNWNYYLPINCIVRREESREKLLQVPLFPSYVFLQASEADLIHVKRIDDVISLLYWLNKPAVIRSDEIEQMKQFLYEHKQVTATKIAVNLEQLPGLFRDVVRIDEEKFEKRRTLRLVLPSLGYVLAAVVEPVKAKGADTDFYEPLQASPIIALN